MAAPPSANVRWPHPIARGREHDRRRRSPGSLAHRRRLSLNPQASALSRDRYGLARHLEGCPSALSFLRARPRPVRHLKVDLPSLSRERRSVPIRILRAQLGATDVRHRRFVAFAQEIDPGDCPVGQWGTRPRRDFIGTCAPTADLCDPASRLGRTDGDAESDSDPVSARHIWPNSVGRTWSSSSCRTNTSSSTRLHAAKQCQCVSRDGSTRYDSRSTYSGRCRPGHWSERSSREEGRDGAVPTTPTDDGVLAPRAALDGPFRTVAPAL